MEGKYPDGVECDVCPLAYQYQDICFEAHYSRPHNPMGVPKEYVCVWDKTNGGFIDYWNWVDEDGNAVKTNGPDGTYSQVVEKLFKGSSSPTEEG